MRVAVTGATGFAGRHLVDILHAAGHEIFGCAKRAPQPPLPIPIQLTELDVVDDASLMRWIRDVRPRAVFHLAAQASVRDSFGTPGATADVNLQGTLNLLSAVHDAGHPCRIVWIGSAEVYGNAGAAAAAISEETPLAPLSPYGESKAKADQVAAEWATAHHLDIVRLRPFPHIGPGQSTRFACADFASQIAAGERDGGVRLVRTGNLDVVRDFTDVRDVVRAYVVFLQRGESGGVFNVCSGVPRRLREVLHELMQMSDRPFEIETDEARWRPSDVPVLVGDARKIREATGWSPLIPWQQTLHDVLADARRRVVARA